MADPDLTRDMLNKRLYVVDAAPAEGSGERAAIFAEHIAFMVGLEREGVLFGSGPILGEDGKPSGHGLTILRCGSAEEAEHIAGADPYVKAGFRTPRIREWQLMEGQVTVRLDFSTGRYVLD